MNQQLVTDPRQIFAERSPCRVVSLVPSWTDSLFELGIGESVVAITDYCPQPMHNGLSLQRVGQPKNPMTDEVIRLNPDLVIANREENGRESIEELSEAGLNIWLTFPQTVQAMLADLRIAASLFRNDRAMRKVQSLEKSAEWVELSTCEQQPIRIFCPVWQDQLNSGEVWWMTFNYLTYSNDVLRICGGENIFAHRIRRYPLMADLGYAPGEEPGERDTRYPRVSLMDVIAANPEVILLPDEPYGYTEAHINEMMAIFAQTTAGESGRIYHIPGNMIHWPGIRLAEALEYLPVQLGF